METPLHCSPQKRIHLSSHIFRSSAGILFILLVNSEESSDACTLNSQQLASQADDQMLRSRLLDVVNCMHADLYSMYFTYIYYMLYTACISIYNYVYLTDTSALTHNTSMCQ